MLNFCQCASKFVLEIPTSILRGILTGRSITTFISIVARRFLKVFCMDFLKHKEHRNQTISAHLQGLNQLRFLAATLVFIQHSLSSSHLDQWIDIGGWRIGRIGTAIFFLLSGFLSAKTSRKPLTWLHERMKFLFPPFWIVTIAGFLLASVTATKSFDTWQVVSQLSGMGYFTHGGHMVNVATWFMSPLILLFLAATLARLISPTIVTLVLVSGLACVALLKAPADATVYCHAVTFFGAFAVALVREKYRTVATMVMAGFMILLACFQSELRYAELASLLLLLALQVEHEVPFCNYFSQISYEWFLVHGLCLATICHLTTSPLTIAIVGVSLSVVAAIALQRTVRWTKSFLYQGALSFLRMQNSEINASHKVPASSQQVSGTVS